MGRNACAVQGGIVIPEPTHHELKNWARGEWSGPWPHPIPPNHAASAEGRWVPPSDLGAEAEKKPAPVNRQRAEIVRVLYKDHMTHSERTVLLQEYIWRHVHQRKARDGTWDFDRLSAAKNAGMPLYVFEPHLVSAARKVTLAMGL